MTKQPMSKQHTHTTECWILFADATPVGVCTSYQQAVIERLRFSKQETEHFTDKKLVFTLQGPVTLDQTP